jgi:hypothetical protein
MPFPRGRRARAILGRAAFLLGYLIRHKWCMLLEGRRFGVPWRVRLAHDADKFWPHYLWLWIVRDEIERCDALHKRRTPHSWEWWADPREPSGYRPMSDPARRELLADWLAAQRMRGGRDYARRVVAFYRERRDAFGFHPSTRAWIGAHLETLEDGAGTPGEETPRAASA